MIKFSVIVVSIAVTACAVEPEQELDVESARRAPEVAFTNCNESIGVGLVDTTAAQALIPPSIIPVGVGTPVTPLVARTARCGIGIAGHRQIGSIVQFGLVIVPPAEPGTIDNYTLGYATDDDRLADLLELDGVQVHRVARIDYDVGSTQLSVTVPAHHPVVTIAGSIQPSTTPNGSFVANWWRATGAGLVEMTTTVPVIANGGADLLLTTSYPPLVDLVGPGPVAFPVLQQFNAFATADMVLTTH